MSVSWTNELELVFIECYHAEPILWDPKHKDHKNKIKVNDAWMRIRAIMNIEVADLKKKKDNLMSSYRSYRKKVKDSEKKSGASSDEIYKPIWFAFDAIDAFLGDIDNCKKTINTEEESVVDKEVVDEQQVVQNPNDQKKLLHTIRRRKNPPELQDAGKIVQDSLATLKSTMNRKESQSDQDDVYELYGKMLAKKIKTLPEDDRLPFMYEIDGIFLRHQQNSRNQYNRFSNSPASYTPTAYGRPSTSRSTYSEHQSPPPSTALYGRPSTAQSNYSEHTINNSLSPVTHNLDNNTYTGSRVMVTSNEVVEPPVIRIRDYSRNTGSRVKVKPNKVIKSRAVHIPDYSTKTDSRVMVTSNDVESPATHYLTNAETPYEMTEDSQTEFGNLIHKAFHLS